MATKRQRGRDWKRRRFKDFTYSSDVLIIQGSRCLLKAEETPRGILDRARFRGGSRSRSYGRPQLDTDEEIVKKYLLRILASIRAA